MKKVADVMTSCFKSSKILFFSGQE